MCALSARLSPHELFVSLVFVFCAWYKLFVSTDSKPNGREIQEALAYRLRQARRETGLTQMEFAERVGATGRAVQFWESGHRTPRSPYLFAIAELTGKPISWFFEVAA